MGVKRNKWTIDNCRADAAKYKTRSEWQKYGYLGYKAADKKGWLELCCMHMISPYLRWTLEKCYSDAAKYQTKAEWQKESSKAFEAARRNNWFSHCCQHMKSRNLSQTSSKKVPIDMLAGNKYDTNSFGIIEIVEYRNCWDVDIIFINTENILRTCSRSIRSGMIKDSQLIKDRSSKN